MSCASNFAPKHVPFLVRVNLSNFIRINQWLFFGSDKLSFVILVVLATVGLGGRMLRIYLLSSVSIVLRFGARSCLCKEILKQEAIGISTTCCQTRIIGTLILPPHSTVLIQTLALLETGRISQGSTVRVVLIL